MSNNLTELPPIRRRHTSDYYAMGLSLNVEDERHTRLEREMQLLEAQRIIAMKNSLIAQMESDIKSLRTELLNSLNKIMAKYETVVKL